MHSIKFNDIDLSRQLEKLNWKGKFYSYDNIKTFLSENNVILIIATYTDKFKTTILSVK